MSEIAGCGSVLWGPPLQRGGEVEVPLVQLGDDLQDGTSQEMSLTGKTPPPRVPEDRRNTGLSKKGSA